MAETGTRPEIEDVLASIRRLVSQDSPRMAETYPAATAPEEADPLLLTPAQLVNDQDGEDDTPAVTVWSGEEPELAAPAAAEHAPEPEPASQPEASAPVELSEARRKPQNFEPEFDDDATQAWPAEPEPPADGLGEELSKLEDTLAHLEAEVARNGVNFEAESGDPFAPAGTEPLTELPEEFSSDHWDVEGGPEAEEAPFMEVISEEDLTEQMEAASTQDSVTEAADFAPMSVEEPAAADTWSAAPAQDWEDLVETVDSFEDPAEIAAPSPSLQTGPLRRLHLSDAEARVPDPDARPSSYEELRTELAADASETEALAALEAELAATADAPGAPLHPGALALNEQQLRQLVSALLREELQGALGSKITRNLRKLVRREVQRALMSRDLE